MTFQELYQLKDLKKEIEEQKRRVSKIDNDELRSILNMNMTEYWRKYIDLEMYINNIPDSFTRRIFRLRFIDGYTWNRIAFLVGGNQTGDSIRKICKRFLERFLDNE